MGFVGKKPSRVALSSDDITDGVIVNADINASAAIAMSKTAFSAGNGVTLSTNTLNVDAAQTTITSLLATDIKIGEDNETKIDFEDANTINFYANNVKEVELAENSLSPGSSDGTALGTTSLMWSDLFLASGGVINLNDGDVTITHASGKLTSTGDLELLRDANNADVKVTLGTSAAESLIIQVLNGSSNKTAEEVHFSTATASGTADHGKMVFDIDGTDILTIDDGGLVIKTTGTIGPVGDEDLITLTASGNIVTVAGELSATTLDIGGTNITSTAAELNLLDGSAKSTSSITLEDSDAFIVIDGTTTKQIPASDISSYAGGSGDAFVLVASGTSADNAGSTDIENIIWKSQHTVDEHSTYRLVVMTPDTRKASTAQPYFQTVFAKTVNASDGTTDATYWTDSTALTTNTGGQQENDYWVKEQSSVQDDQDFFGENNGAIPYLFRANASNSTYNYYTNYHVIFEFGPGHYYDSTVGRIGTSGFWRASAQMFDSDGVSSIGDMSGSAWSQGMFRQRGYSGNTSKLVKYTDLCGIKLSWDGAGNEGSTQTRRWFLYQHQQSI